ncbi:hypothetical protein D3C87_1795750 [compost metagenome]
MRQVAGQGDPGRQSAGATLGEGVKHGVDQFQRGALVCAEARDGGVQGLAQVRHHRPHQRRLKAGGRAEVVDQVGVGDTDVRRDRRQGHRIGAARQQQGASGVHSLSARLFRRAATATRFFDRGN